MTDESQIPALEVLQELMAQRNFRALRQLFKDAQAADIAELFSDVSPDEAIILFRLISRIRRPLVFAYLPFERQESLLEDLPDEVVTSLVNEMEPDDRTKLLQDLPTEIRRKMLMKLSPEERRMAWQLLNYPEDSVGRLMNPEFLGVRADMKLAAAIEFIRWNTATPEELGSYVFVIDVHGNLMGEVSLAALLMADAPGQTMVSIMEPASVKLLVTDEKTKAVDIFRKYDRVHVPVVNEIDVLLGVVTADDVFDIAEETATEDIQQFGGQATLEDSYFQTPLVTLLRKRAGWLSFLFLGELFTGTALRHYDDAIASMRYLVYFVPLIISSGGNSGSQAASLVIRGIAVKEMAIADWLRVLRREIVTGMLLGVILGVLGFSRALTWGNGIEVAAIVGISLVGVVTFGGIVGSMLPFLFKKMRLDPAISSSPFIASFVDVTGIVIYFTIANLATKYWESIFGNAPHL